MMIKNKKVYMIFLIACLVTSVLGIILLNIKATTNVGEIVYLISCILGIFVGTLRMFIDYLKKVLRKKETRLVALSIPAFIIKWYFKLCWIFIVAGLGVFIFLLVPLGSAIGAYITYKNELIEV